MHFLDIVSEINYTSQPFNQRKYHKSFLIKFNEIFDKTKKVFNRFPNPTVQYKRAKNHIAKPKTIFSADKLTIYRKLVQIFASLNCV